MAPRHSECGEESRAAGHQSAALGRTAVRLTREPIDVAELQRQVENADAGAIATFVGTVRAERNDAGRDLTGLEYTAYEPMAIREMEAIAQRAVEQYGLRAVRLVHRLGALRIGEASVAVVVSAGHRAEAFHACRQIIEQLKADVPIFKRECWAGGKTSWVG